MNARQSNEPDELLEASGARIDEETSSAEALSASLARAREHSERQGWIAKFIIAAYSIVIGCAVFADVLAGWMPARQAALSAAGGQIRDMANTLILPLVTLVIGHYFGQRSR